VGWSDSKKTFIYGNHKIVKFKPPSCPPTPKPTPQPLQHLKDSDEEASVTCLLNKTKEILTAATATLTSTPKVTSTALPGEFPSTPPLQPKKTTALPTPSSLGSTTVHQPPDKEPTPAPQPAATIAAVSSIGQPTSWSSLAKGKNPIKSNNPSQSLPQQPAPVMASTSGTTTTAAITAPAKYLGSTPEQFDGKADKAQAFWSSLENYFYLNNAAFTNEGKKVTTALTYFKMGTPTGEWACDKQNTALAATPVDFGTWADFKTTFKKHFIPAESELQAITAMYNTPMHQREFNEWYQEWLTYATRAGVDERTKMYTFHRMLPRPLHEKIIALSPQPTTLMDLVEKARNFDCSWQLFQGPAFQGQKGHGPRAHATTTQDDTQINLFTGVVLGKFGLVWFKPLLAKP
jgi:hypothetical protein